MCGGGRGVIEHFIRHPSRFVARALLALVGSRAPQSGSELARDVSTSQRFGPFFPGQVVRIQCDRDYWYIFGGPNEVVTQTGNGVPMPSRRHVDHLVDDAARAYVFVVQDTAAAGTGYAIVWPVGHVIAE